MRILFMGTPEFAVPSLRALVDAGYEVIGAVTQPDRPAGRGHKLVPSPLKAAAQQLGLAVYPGCTTPTEYQMGLEYGLEVL